MTPATLRAYVAELGETLAELERQAGPLRLMQRNALEVLELLEAGKLDPVQREGLAPTTGPAGPAIPPRASAP